METVLKVIGCLFLALLALVSFGAIYMYATSDVPLTESDRIVVLRAGDLTPYFSNYAPDEKYEIFEKVRYLDRSVELNYEYDSPLDDEPYISVTVSFERSRTDANAVYLMAWSAQSIAFKLFDESIDVIESNVLLFPGTQTRFGDIVSDNEVVGHVIVVRKANTVYAFTIAGFTFSDPDIWHELLDKRIASL